MFWLDTEDNKPNTAQKANIHQLHKINTKK